MKRYLVFAGSDYYPCGGWEDFRSSHDTIKEAKESVVAAGGKEDWWHILDIESSVTVMDGGYHHRDGSGIVRKIRIPEEV